MLEIFSVNIETGFFFLLNTRWFSASLEQRRAISPKRLKSLEGSWCHGGLVSACVWIEHVAASLRTYGFRKCSLF